jgi:hypothetical protein
MNEFPTFFHDGFVNLFITPSAQESPPARLVCRGILQKFTTKLTL